MTREVDKANLHRVISAGVFQPRDTNAGPLVMLAFIWRVTNVCI